MTTPQTTSAAENVAINGVKDAFPADVVAFASANGIEHCLQPMWDATRRIFSTARHVEMSVVVDSELQDNTQIAFRVQLTGLPFSEVHEADKQWGQELFRICPPRQKFFFCLLLDLKR